MGEPKRRGDGLSDVVGFHTPPQPVAPKLADAVADSPARALQARLATAYPRNGPGAADPFRSLLLVRLAVLLGSACGLWVCLSGLAFLIMR